MTQSIAIKKIKKSLFVTLILFLLLIAFSRFDTQSIIFSIRQISLWSFVLLLVMQIGSQLLVNFQWYKIAQTGNVRVSFNEMFYINCQGAVMDSITPGVKIGGEITRAVQLSRQTQCSAEQAAAVVALQKLFSMSAFLFINLFAAGFLAGRVPLLQARYIQFLIFGISAVLLVLFSLIFIIPEIIKKSLVSKQKTRFSWLSKLKQFFLTLLDHVMSIKKNNKAWISLFLLSLVIWLVYPIKLYILAIHFFPGVNIIYLGAIAFISYMIAMIPIFPGGLGGFESTMIALLFAIGFLHTDALVVTVLFRFISFWFVMLMSLAVIGVYKMSFNNFFFSANLCALCVKILILPSVSL